MSTTRSFRPVQSVCLVAVIVVALIASGCGNKKQTVSNKYDTAFVIAMTPLITNSIELAKISARLNQHKTVSGMTDAISSTRQGQLAVLKSAATELGIEPGKGDVAAAAKTLGLPAAQPGYTGNPGELESAKPFDKAFLNAMILQNKASLKMAYAQAAQGSLDPLKQVSSEIVARETQELEAMKQLLQQYYPN